ncbi:oligosaccharide flippase family protein [Novosphingobium profundi]|uniref:oligosaccharide flippase family protein n=1 Tax=Novosphingobium profundi TaxID=1774954 RepID=UPI001CFC4BF3|nr:oligosaccharide flippase family protein [Novosphingobium profundi]
MANFGKAAFSATLWAGAGRAGRSIAQAVFMLVLANAIGPSGFAASSIALIGYQLSSTLATQSFSMALVRYSEPDDRRDAAAFWLNLGLTFVSFVCAALVGLPVAEWLSLPSLVWLLPLMTGLGLIAAPTVLAQAQMSRMMAFRPLAQIETVSSIVSAACGCLAAIGGLGIYALVVYAGMQRLIEVVGFVRHAPVWPKALPERKEVRALVHFTLPLAGMQVLTFANGSIDQFFVGQVGTPTSLGYYGLARRFSQQPTQMITFAINRAIYPAFVHLDKEPEEQAAFFMRSIRLSLIVASLPLFLLALIAGDLLSLLMGSTWQAAGPYLALFAATSSVLPLGGVLAAALRAKGHTALQMLFQLVRLVVITLALGIMVWLEADIWTLALTVALLSVMALILPLWEVVRVFDLSWPRVGREILVGLAPATIMVLGVLLLDRYAVAGTPVFAQIACEIAIGALLGGLAGLAVLKRVKVLGIPS